MGLPERILVTKVVPAYPTYKYMKGRQGKAINHVVIHTTDARTISSTLDWFGRHPDCRVSAHYVIGEQGEVVQMVSEYDTAYHAGNFNMNLTSIGIEHVGLSGGYYEPEQLEKSAKLVAYICRGHKIPIQNIIRHSEVPGSTHACPGPSFPFRKYKLMVEQEIKKL